MIIVSNTSPINYLILIGHINLLPELFQQIILGILDQAATMKLIDLPTAVQNLQSTSFWASDSLIQKLLDKHS
jgi:predicted nucleic acid-binding protein